MPEDLAQKAIAAAIAGQWPQALELNRELLKQDKSNITALNRLAHAQTELGKIKEAKLIYQRVLRLDRYNPIALRNLEKLKKRKVRGQRKSLVLDTSFLEEPGKTKMALLLHLGDEKVIAQLDSGEEVQLSAGRYRVSVQTTNGKYVGRLPDDLSVRLIKFIRGGSVYQVLVKSAEPAEVKVFLREVEKSQKFANTPSFPAAPKEKEYVAFTPPDLIHEEKPEVTTLEELEEEVSTEEEI